MAFNPKTKLFVDTETNGLRVHHGDRPYMIQLGDQDNNKWFCQWPVNPFTREVTPDKRDLRFLRELLLDPALPKDSFNRKFDQRMLAAVGLNVKGRFDDSFLKARICRTNEVEYSLNYLANKYFDIDDKDAYRLKAAVARARNYGRQQGWKLYTYGDHPELADYWMIALHDPSNTDLETYALKDIDRLWSVSKMYDWVMEQDPARRKAYEKELELLPRVMKMEARGVSINPVLNEQQRVFYIGEFERYRDECQKMLIKDKKVWWNEEKRYVYKRTGEKKAVETFNPGSGPQCARVIYEDTPEGYGLECVRWTDKGNPSTDWKALREYSDHPFVRVLTLCNGAKKASEFFVQYAEMSVQEQLNNSPIWVLHCEFDQGGTKTLRFSCRKPNMQQAAKGGGVSKARSRGPIKPRPGYRFYMFDYANQEARIFAEIAQIQELIDACSTPGQDVNTVLANKIWGGKGNKKALISAARALELGNEFPTNLLAVQARQRLGWQNNWCSLGVTSQMALKFADKFLSLYDYDIVKAEKAVDPEGSSFTRTRAKNVLFAKLYGGGATAVMDFMFCSKREAYEMLQDFEEAWPGIVAAMNEIIEVCEAQGYIETLYGNKLDIDPGFEYKGINYLVQGCLHGTSQIVTKEHGPKAIRLLSGKWITVWDGDKWVKAQVLPSGKKQLVTLTLTGNHTIKCSPKHKFWCTNSAGNSYWREVANITSQEYISLGEEVDWDGPIPCLPNGNTFNANNCSFDNLNKKQIGEWVGRVASDGSVCRDKSVYLLIAEHEKELLPVLEEYTTTIGRCSTTICKQKETHHKPLYRINLASKSIANYLLDCGIKEKIPRFILRDKEMLRGYLRGFFDGDGTVGTGGALVTFGKGSKHYLTLAREFQNALLLFGIRSRINQCADRINLRVWKKDSALFAEKIGFMNSSKQAKIESVVPGAHYYKTNSSIYGRAYRVDNVDISNTYVEMWDVCNSESGKFMANGLVTHNTAAAMMKDSMLRLDNYLLRTRLDAHIVMTVHDELVFEIKIGHDRPWLLRGIKAIMENNHGRIRSLPMVVEAARAVSRWDEKESLIVDAKGVRVDQKVKSKVGEWIMPIIKREKVKL